MENSSSKPFPGKTSLSEGAPSRVRSGPRGRRHRPKRWPRAGGPFPPAFPCGYDPARLLRFVSTTLWNGGQAHDAEDRFARLETWTRERFPVASIARRWSGQVMESVDSLAFIGRNPGNRNVYVATGDSGNGMTHGTIAGILLSALIQGRDHDWAKLYDPSVEAGEPKKG